MAMGQKWYISSSAQHAINFLNNIWQKSIFHRNSIEKKFCKNSSNISSLFVAYMKVQQKTNFFWIINRGISKKGLGIPKNENQFCASVAALAVLAPFQKAAGKSNMFAGIAYCADCKSKMYYCTSQYFDSRQDYFVCSGANKGKDVCGSKHYIRAVVLEKGVLAHLKYVIGYIAGFEQQFREAMGEKHKSDVKKDLTAKKKLLAKTENRIAELDRLFKCIYEDKSKGILSENRFQMLADDYEKEQEELQVKIDKLTSEISETEEQSGNLERFITKIHKYLNLQELTPAILNDLVKCVYVHAPQMIDGKRTQEIDICYDLVGILPKALFQKNEETA